MSVSSSCSCPSLLPWCLLCQAVSHQSAFQSSPRLQRFFTGANLPPLLRLRRHGNRFDAANKQWHLQSPTPYDPPLTYSGWNQARAVGQRIGEILREREAQDEAASASPERPARKRRKYKVVLHSSPFLRCVQTSIGISAGLASMPEPKPAVPTRASSTHSVTNPRLRSSLGVDTHPPASNSLSQPFSDLPTPPETETGSRPSSPKTPVVEKIVLRLDAFLGEWLTPGYFELITPPPGSGLMLAGAKANLLRKEDYSNNPNFASYNNATHGQSWAPTPTTPIQNLESGSSLADALRRAGRSDSVTSVTSNGESRLMAGGAYVAPIPTYAISHNAEIPNGYVPHARDNCCDVDYQWDSMRGALDWGDGGSLGEEWASMHNRFRKGLQRLVDWYATAENPTQMVTKERRASVDDYEVVDDDDDVEVEPVVVLVSHGAGCNALIGAITHQPVLTDVGLASLTEAVRKPDVIEVEDDASSHVAAGSRSTSKPSSTIAIHECYDLKLFASSEHLSSTRARTTSLTTGSMNLPPSRGRLNSSGLTASPLGIANSRLLSNEGPVGRSSASATWANMRRGSEASSQLSGRLGLNTNGLSGGITVGSGATTFSRQTPAAGGLWSPLRSTMDAADEDDNFLPNFSAFDTTTGSAAAKAERTPPTEGTIKPRPSTPKSTNGNGPGRGRSDSTVSPRTNAIGNTLASAIHEEEEHEHEHEHVSALPQLGSGTGGLWGSPRPLGPQEIPRDLSSPKRRWTVTGR